MKKIISNTVVACGLCALVVNALNAAAIEPVALSGSLSAGDDQTTGDVNLGFSINFGTGTYTSVAVNTNGILSFGDGGFGQGTPTNLSDTGRVLIAPFWADADTRGIGTIQFGNATVAGRQSFVATYLNVGFYLVNTSKTNSFQLILLDRADTGAGNFDVELNYNQIQWESGDNSGGLNGLGGTAAVVGLRADGTATELPGSLIAGSFVDGSSGSLVANSLNSRGGAAGRYDFSVRSGEITTAIPEPSSLLLLGAGLAAMIGGFKKRRS